MESSRLAVLSLFCFALIGSHVHAALPAQDYWRSLWPNTPMPKVLRDLAQPGLWMEGNNSEDKMGKGKSEQHEFLVKNGTVNESSDPRERQVPQNLTGFFFEQDLQRGRSMNLLLAYIPTAWYKLFYTYVSEADTSTNLLRWCQNSSSGSKVEDTFCATSFESLINFPISVLGKNIRVLPEELEKETQKQQWYRIGEGVKKVGDKAVVCHKLLKYPYALFSCHEVHATRAYAVPLVTSNGTKTKGLVVCHTDTSGWSPKHVAFQVLKVKPGTVPVCHLLPFDDLLWYIPT